MTYSGAATAKGARETLGRALASLQEDPNIPQDVLAVAQNLAQAVGALFEAERAADESAGKASVKGALGLIGQTLALLQDVRGQHRGIQLATESLAQSMSLLYPLTAVPSMRPPAANAPLMGTPSPVAQPAAQAYDATVQQAPFQVPQASQPTQVQSPPFQQSPAYNPQQAAFSAPQQAPQAAFSQPQQAPQAAPQQAPQAAPQQVAPQAAFSQPQAARPAQQSAPQAAPAAQKPATSAANAEAVGYRGNEKRETIEVNIGATTESNFFVGFSGEISEGGVFAATYNISGRGTPLRLLVTLPGGFEKHVNGRVRFVRDPMDMAADETTPGMGVPFEGLDAEARELILRFVRKRAPMFYDE